MRLRRLRQHGELPLTRSTEREPPAPQSAASLAALAVALVTLLTYLNAAPPAAVHDDKFFVPSVFRLDGGGLHHIFTEDPWGAAGAPAGRYRPLLLITFALDGVTYGTDLWGYHLTNIAIHVATTLLLLLVVGRLLEGAGTPGGVGWLAAAVAAATFGVHPIHTEAVDSVFNRSEMLVALGTLVAFAAVIRWEPTRPARAWTAVGVAFLAALLCRENAAVLPVLVAALVWLLHPEEDARTRARRLAPVVTLALPFALYLALRAVALVHVVPPEAPPLAENLAEDGTLAGRLALFLTTMREYLRMMVWPHPLRASYEDFAPTGVATAVVVQALLVGAAVWMWRRSPWLAFGLGFFYLALLPSTRLLTAASHASGFLAQPASGLILVAERTLYMPSAGLVIPLAFALAAVGRRYGPAPVVAAGVALVAVLAPITYARNVDWHSDVALWEAEVRAEPANGDAWRLLTGAYIGAGRNVDTARACDRVLAAHPHLAQLANNCAIAYDRIGRLTDAEAAYHHAIELGLASVGHANLGRLLERVGRRDDAEREYRAAFEAEQEPGRKHFRRGQWLVKFHPEQLDEAEHEFEAASELLPDWNLPREALAQARAQRRRGG